MITKLSKIKRNKSFKFISIPNEQVRTQLIRFGIGEGSHAKCHQKLPFGPVVVKFQKQEIALGREIANEITIEDLV